MMRGMFAAISGLRVHQIMLDVTANNISNVNTVGYKGERVSFKDTLWQMQKGAGAPAAALGGTNAAQIGLGVQMNSIDNIMGTGAIQTTGNTFDLAIQGEGWFQISTDPTSAAAPIYYTRSGNFTRDANGDLVNPEGYYLVGWNGAANARINVPANAQSVSIDSAGVVTVIPAAGPPPVLYNIQLAKFPNENGLVRLSGNRFSMSNNSGAATVANAGTPGFGAIAPGTLEMSNVDLAQEFTSMITAQRGFQATSRVISTADDMLQELVNLKR
jgi:flagellar hook protein FlgE